MRLSADTIHAVSPEVHRPGYDRAAQQVGIVHFGIGAFHRAHQAWYTDACMNAGESDWMIAGVSLRSGTVAQQLNPQDGLYTLVERSGESGEARMIGAVREVLVGGADDDAILSHLAAPTTHIVSFTVTEKGYCRAADRSLDLVAAREGSFYPHLARAMRERKQAGSGGLTLLSCDNLAHNGNRLAQLMREYLGAEAPDLVAWFDAECTCPNSMVDRIVPAATPADLDAAQGLLGGVRDEGAVFAEAFSQWVIEDRFAGPRPSWEKHGAQLVADVAPYETAKLRMLNGAHSLLAYAGLSRGYQFVHEAVADPALRTLVERLMRDEAAPTISAASGQDLNAYADRLLARFSDPALRHRLAQIAMDGSEKLPQRWLETLAHDPQQHCGAILSGIAAWLWHLADGRFVDDPRGGELRALVAATPRDRLLATIFGQDGHLASRWSPSDADCRTVENKLGELS